MAQNRRAFTLTELLVVLAIISVIASVLFPVFASVKSASRRASCVSNYHQVSAASGLYTSDYDDRFVPVNHQPATEPNSRNDKTWVQLVLPYLRSFNVFQCPSDTSDRPRPAATYDQDLVPGDSYSEFYSASLRSNIAYNYLYLSPIIRFGKGDWMAAPRSGTEIAEPTSTILFVDSVWALNENGVPTGGGSWLVVPPCRFEAVNGRKVDTFADSTGGRQVFVANAADGWTAPEERSPLLYGGAWPWHQGKMTVAYVDGSVRVVSPPQLWEGCHMLEHWEGSIEDSSRYPWDLR